MRKTLELIAAGIIGLTGFTTGCMTPTAPQVKQYKEIQRLPLEKEFFEHINTPNFDLAEAAFMATGLNAWELQEFKKTFNAKLEKLSKTPQFKQSKTIPEKTQAIFEGLHDFRKYNWKTSEITSAMGRKGNCMGGTVYLNMSAQRFGINLNSVIVEKHIFSRLNYQGKKINIENILYNGFNLTLKYDWEKEITDNKTLLREYTENLATQRRINKEKKLALTFYIVSAKIKPEASTTYPVAHLARQQGGPNREVKILREIYERHPKNNLIQEILARALNNRNNPEDLPEAITLYQDVVKGHEDDEFKTYFMGLLYSKAKMHDQAAHYFRLSQKINPQDKEYSQRAKNSERKMKR